MISLKNTLDYYYNIRIDKLIKSNNDYYFYMDNKEYHLIKYDRPIEDINSIFKLNMELLKDFG